MKIETVAREDQQTKLIAEIEPETFDRFMHQAARKISKSVKIPGFRPGKAPYEMVARMVGESEIQREAVDLLLEEVYPKILEEANITPSGPGQLEEIVSLDPPTFSFIVPLQPEVNLGDYQSIESPYEPEPITDEQVEQTLRRLQRNMAPAVPVERPAQQGDMVSFKMSGKRTQPEEGENETLFDETPYQMIAGDDDDDNEEAWPYPGFTKELIGLSANDTKTITYTFDDESPYEDLRGKEAEFHVEVQNVKELDLPELNDEFAQSLGDFETLEDLRKVIRTQLEQNYQQQYDNEYFENLINELISKSTVKYPPHMLNQEIEDLLHSFQHNLERDRLDLDTYLKMREMDRDTFIEKEVKPQAEQRLVRSLVLEEFARQENIQVKNDEIAAIYNAALQQVQPADNKKIQSRNRINPREMANSITISTVNNIFNQRLMSRLKAIATGEPETTAMPELMTADESDEQPESQVQPESAPQAEAVVEAEAATPSMESEDQEAAEEADLPAEPEDQAGEESGETE
ncbi:MAG: trigger factor [Chloroflexi bacterium]|nr:trigger factor [Chloroflexota bacterium]